MQNNKRKMIPKTPEMIHCKIQKKIPENYFVVLLESTKICHPRNKQEAIRTHRQYGKVTKMILSHEIKGSQKFKWMKFKI